MRPMTPRASVSGGRMAFTPARLGGIQLQRRTVFRGRISWPRCSRKRRLKSKGMSRLARSTCIATQAIANALPVLPMPFRSLTNRYLRRDGFPKDVGTTLSFASMKRFARSGYITRQDIPIGHALLVAHRSPFQVGWLPKGWWGIALFSIR